MKKLANTNPIDILKHIVRHVKIDRSTYTIIITGRVGPTGKTWLRNELVKKGYRAMEVTALTMSELLNNDGINHVIIDEDAKHVVVVLNEILPMYWDEGFEVADFVPQNAVIFETRASAHEFLLQIWGIAKRYGVITLADLKDMLNLKFERNDHKYGWVPESIYTAYVVPHDYGYSIEFPKALRID